MQVPMVLPIGRPYSFDPSQRKLWTWIDLTDLDTLRLDPSNRIAQARDKSGHGRNFGNSDPAQRPYAKVRTLNGLHTADFPTGCRLTWSPNPLPSWTVFSVAAVVMADVTNIQGQIFSWSAGTGGSFGFANTAQWRNYLTVGPVVGGSYTTGVKYACIGTFTVGGGSSNFDVNGVNQISGAGVNGIAALDIGGNSTNGSTIDGAISELFVEPVLWDAMLKRDIFGYFARKYRTT